MRTPARHLVATIGLVAACASPATAALITDLDPNPDLTLNTSPAVFYQQTTASPCVIGGENCQNPVGFLYTSSEAGAPSLLTLSSPVYTTAQILGVTGNSAAFTIGIDYNDTSTAQALYSFSANYFGLGGALLSSQLFNEDAPLALATINNGVGYSDFLLSGFLIPDNTLTVQFTASWSNNDGPDRYFIIGANAPPPCTSNCGGTPTPEPASIALFGLAAGAMAMARRRKKQ